MDKNSRVPVKIEIVGEPQTEASGQIVAIGASARPLPFQTIFEFDHPALSGIGSEGDRGAAGNGYDGSVEARGFGWTGRIFGA
jgi:hypothetical protein